MESSHDLFSLVLKKMESNRSELIQNRKYFYPLAEPTYGVEEVMEAIDSMTAFKTSMWEKVLEFEQKFGDKYGGEAIMVNSGSSADLLIAFALLEKSGGKLQPGDEILVPAVTWPTHLWSLIMAGFSVRLIDINLETLNFDIESIKASIGPRTRGIFIVHLLGNSGDMEQLVQLCNQQNLVLLEDTCEALGAKFQSKYLGTFGLASSFSFFFSHHLVTMEGGMILTADSDLARRLRLLRAHGWTRNANDMKINHFNSINERYNFVSWGFNVRPTELQAGFGLAQLKKIDDFHLARIENAQFLCGALDKYSHSIQTMKIDSRVECSWFALPILLTKNASFSREELSTYLEMNGIETRPTVAGNLARQPAMSKFPEVKYSTLPNADYIHNQGLYIGIHPVTPEKILSRVVEVFDQFLNAHGVEFD